MAAATLAREAQRLLAEARGRAPTDSPLLRAIRRAPEEILTRAGISPDPWQLDLSRSSDARVLILACRQVGKSLVAGCLALREALLHPGATILLLAPSERQAAELLRDKVLRLWAALGRPLGAGADNALRLELANGSRIIALPGKEATIRVYASVRLLVIDEAARVPDALFHAVTPMLAVSRGRLVCLSSAYAQAGFFYESWSQGGERWRRVQVLAAECPRISPEFLAEELAAMGQRLYDREYNGVFTSADDAVFDPDAIDRALAAECSGPPLF